MYDQKYSCVTDNHLIDMGAKINITYIPSPYSSNGILCNARNLRLSKFHCHILIFFVISIEVRKNYAVVLFSQFSAVFMCHFHT